MYRMFGILQIDDEREENRDKLFVPYSYLEKKHINLDPEDYKMIYADEIFINESEGDDISMHDLDKIYEKYNIDFPEDYVGRSMSISDVIMFDDCAFYVDMFGFHKLDEFEFGRFREMFDVESYFLPFN